MRLLVRRPLSAACLVFQVLGFARLAAPQTSGPVSLLVTVVAPAKAPITDLAAKDFKVQDGKQPVDVAAAERATTPLSIVLIVENTLPGMSAAPRTQELRASLRAFVNAIRAGAADAQIAMFTDAGASVPVIGLKASPADLDNAINLLTPAKQSPGALIAGIADAATLLRDVPAPRRAIVAMDFSSPDPTPMAVLQSVGTAVLRSRATLWSVSVSGTVPETPSRNAILDDLTSATGGARTMIVGASGLENQLKAIANSLLSQYTLHVAVPAGDPQSLRVQTPKGKALVSTVDVR